MKHLFEHLLYLLCSKLPTSPLQPLFVQAVFRLSLTRTPHCVKGTIIYNRQGLEAAQVPISREVDEKKL